MDTFSSLVDDENIIIESAVHTVWYKMYRDDIGLTGDFNEDLWNSYLLEVSEAFKKSDMTKEKLIKIVQEKYLSDPHIKEKYYEGIKRSDFEIEKSSRAFLMIMKCGDDRVNDDLAWEEYKKRYGEDISREELFDLITEKLLQISTEKTEDFDRIRESRAKKRIKKFGH